MGGLVKFTAAILLVLGTVSTALWMWSVVTSKHHHPFNFWAVCVFAVLFFAALLWGSQREGSSGVTHHHHYYESVTWTVGASAPTTGTLEQIGPAFLQGSGELEVVKLSDHVEWRSDGPPIIRNRQFRNVKLRGPIVLGPLKPFGFANVGFGVADDDLESMLFEFGRSEIKVAVAVIQNVLIENCITEHVGILGPREQLDAFREAVESGAPRVGTQA